MHKIFAIAITTYREAIRSKILIVTLFFAILMVLAASLFANVAIGDRFKVVKDFGLTAISLFSVLFVTISGATLLFKEGQRKTIFNILSKAVGRYQVLLGKYIGLTATGVLLIWTMGLLLSAFVYLISGQLDKGLLIGYFSISLELLVVSALVIFFSSFVVTPLLIGIFTFSIFLIGRSSEYLITFSENSGIEWIRFLRIIIPRFDSLYIGNDLVYGWRPDASQLIWSGIYCLGYVLILLILGIVGFTRRQFNQ